MTTSVLTARQTQIVLNKFVARVYLWMFAGLGMTGLIAFLTANSPVLSGWIFSNEWVFYGLCGLELVLVWFFASIVEKIPAPLAMLIFTIYAMLSGLTVSGLFLIYSSGSIASTFFITAGTFGTMSLYGYYTQKDLTSLGSIAFMGLIGIILASVVNLFLESSFLYWITTYIGILVFIGLTVYDAQKIRELGLTQTDGTEAGKKAAIIAALSLYLDFINLFILLLRVFGRDD